MSGSSISKWLQQGAALHTAGRLAEADRLYAKVLKLDPRNPDALNLKGLIAAHASRHAEAVTLYEKAIAAFPEFADAYYNKGVALAALEQNTEAIEAYARAIQLQPAHADARLNTGSLLHKMGRTEEAITAFRAMTQLYPRDWRGFYNLGSSLSMRFSTASEETRAASTNDAVAALTQALTLNPENADVRVALAHAQAQSGDYAAAAEVLSATLEKTPGWTDERRAEILSTLGEYLRKLKRYSAAIESHEKALAICPAHHLFQFNLAATLYDAGRRDEAERAYERAIETKPDFVRAYINLSNIHRDKNDHQKAVSLLEQALTFGDAFEAYTNIASALSNLGWISTSLMIHDKAISLGSTNATTRYNRALTLLHLGRFKSGWVEHETRFDVDTFRALSRRKLEWRGEDLAGKRILIWAEQGIGDQILHGSMIPEIIERAGHVLIECVDRLAPVFERSFPGTTVVGRTNPTASPADAEPYDVQIAAGSLGRYLRNDHESFPLRVRYLVADPQMVQAFRRKYSDMAKGRRIVGLAWRSLRHHIGAYKSTKLTDLAPVLQTPNTFFVNLQYGDCTAELGEARSTFGTDIFQDPEVDQLKDMDIFFAQVAAMDQVITTSNTTVHVAGSQGVPTRLLLPHGKGVVWYWFHHRADSPWYPSVKIFRAGTTNADQAWAMEPAQRIAADMVNPPLQTERDAP